MYYSYSCLSVRNLYKSWQLTSVHTWHLSVRPPSCKRQRCRTLWTFNMHVPGYESAHGYVFVVLWWTCVASAFSALLNWLQQDSTLPLGWVRALHPCALMALGEADATVSYLAMLIYFIDETHCSRVKLTVASFVVVVNVNALKSRVSGWVVETCVRMRKRKGNPRGLAGMLTCQSSRPHSYHLSTTTPHIAHAVWFKIIASHSYHLSTTTPHIAHAVWFHILNVPILSLSQLSSLHHHTSYCTCCMVSYS